jgi:hypothetical protein
MGDTPNPPEDCGVQFAVVNNKTYAQFSCRPGHNQGGSTSFLTIYERSTSGGANTLKLSGRVNIADDSMMNKEVPYITPAEKDSYYEFLIFQENNFGNSTAILLTLGESQKEASGWRVPPRTMYMIAIVAACVIFVVFVCSCCCCSDVCSSSSGSSSAAAAKNDTSSSCCKWCSSASDHSMEDDGISYKKAPLVDMDGHLHQINGNQSFPAYSSSESSSSLANGKVTNQGQSYDYYDNTSTGLLDNDSHYSRNNNPYHKPLIQKTTTLTRKISGQIRQQQKHEDHYNPYDHHETNMDNEEPYMNDEDDLNTSNLNNTTTLLRQQQQKQSKAKRVVVVVNNKQFTYEDDQEDDLEDSLSANSLPKSGSGGSGVDSSENGVTLQNAAKLKPPPPPVPASVPAVPPKQTLTNSTAIFNNNVCVNLGSGVESFNKRLNSANYTKSFKPSINNNVSNANVNNSNKSNYSTVDSKNLKFIKTDNGLVYTPINYSNPDRNKSNDALMVEDDDDDDDEDEDEDDNYEDPIQEPTQKNESQITSKPNQNSLSSRHQIVPNTYGSIRKQHQQQPTLTNNFQNELNTRLKTINSSTKSDTNHLYSKNYGNGAPYPPANTNNTLNVNEPACVKINSSNNSTATTSISSASSCTSHSDLVNNKPPIDTNYSLLKTTLNVPSLPTQKPPILKPKPKNLIINNYATEATKNEQNANPNPPQVTHHLHSSFNTSPSTSITDVSSTNCTPQHFNECKKANNNHPGGYYESVNLLSGSTLNRINVGNTTSIDDEMKAVKSGGFTSKTLERRHVKNSEC